MIFKALQGMRPRYLWNYIYPITSACLPSHHTGKMCCRPHQLKSDWWGPQRKLSRPLPPLRGSLPPTRGEAGPHSLGLPQWLCTFSWSKQMVPWKPPPPFNQFVTFLAFFQFYILFFMFLIFHWTPPRITLWRRWTVLKYDKQMISEFRVCFAVGKWCYI